MYLAYADEFGHVGPYTGRNEPKFNESPVFGLGGILLPVDQVRPFATWFFQLKSNLLAWEIRRSGGARLLVGEERLAALHNRKHSQIQGAPHCDKQNPEPSPLGWRLVLLRW